MTEITTARVLVVTVVMAIAAIKVFVHSRSRGSNSVVPNIVPDESTSSSSSSSSSTSQSWKYDVFLSFRGEDTRKTFVDHLYSALEKHGIVTYKDDVTLDRGDTITPALLTAIRKSHIALIIFSENYADSSWCLDELSYIMKCKEEASGQIVIPIFYNVDPSDVRKQRGQFGKAFAKLHKLFKNKKVESWKKALVDASNIAGWEPKHVANGHEARCIQEIVGSILDKLPSSNSTVEDENLIGMGIRLEQLKFQLEIGSGGVRMVGIWGIGGGGKTTLATSLYKEFFPNFDGSCFLGNIREETKQHGLKSLQEKLLSNVFDKSIQVESVELGKDKIKQMLCRRKVLMVLDDVDHLDQLKALAACPKWFGDGSRIIITTRDRHLLTTVDEIKVSPINLLSREEAVRLFNKHAYNKNKPVEDYKTLSQQIVTYADGLPLALIVWGSFLYDKVKDEWLSTLDRLKYHPEMDIVEKLKISYDGLKLVEKELFLDIVCFFRRVMKNKAMEILDACGFHSTVGIKVLKEKALITVSMNDVLDMHDLIQEMGQFIVRGEHPNNPEKHSRVWRKEDIEEICYRNATMENDKIEAIQSIQCYAQVRSFNLLVSNMKKLRFLIVRTTPFDEGPSFLSNELRYIDWDGYPASPFPESFHPTKLVVLKLNGSLQKELWKGYKYLPCLKEMELSHMKALVRTPDAGLPCLQKLILETCESLEEIHLSLGNHSSLVCLSVSKCDNLISLELTDCSNLKSIEGLKKFKLCHLSRSLRKLYLQWCGLKDGVIPTEIGELSNLQELYLDGNNFTRLDFSLSRLTSLKLLELSCCINLVELPELPPSLAILVADECNSLETISDGSHTYCKWLCKVSLKDGRNIIGGERLLETMIQGNAAESGCLSLYLEGVEIAKGLIVSPRLVRGRRCRMQLPENWYNHFSGFLFCAVFDTPSSVINWFCPIISMKHEENGGFAQTLEDSQHDVVYWEEESGGGVDKKKSTWIGYVPFSLLRHTSWWDPASTAIQMGIEIFENHLKISGCGFKLLPKRTVERSSGQMEITTTHSSYEISDDDDDDDDDYKCKIIIQHDSKSALRCKFPLHCEKS